MARVLARAAGRAVVMAAAPLRATASPLLNGGITRAMGGRVGSVAQGAMQLQRTGARWTSTGTSGRGHAVDVAAQLLLLAVLGCGTVWATKFVLKVWLAHTYEDRRVAGVKKRLRDALQAPQRTDASSRSSGPELVARPTALARLQGLLRHPTVLLLHGPQGAGTSSLLRLLEAQQPGVVRVALRDDDDLDAVARATADAVGYRLQRTWLEDLLEKPDDDWLPKETAVAGRARFSRLMRSVERALRELREDGSLGDRVPVLAFDRTTNSWPGMSGSPVKIDKPSCGLVEASGSDEVFDAIFNWGGQLSNDKLASTVIVAGNEQQWPLRCTSRNTGVNVRTARVGDLTDAEANSLIARSIWRQLQPYNSLSSKSGAAPVGQDRREPGYDDLQVVLERSAATIKFAQFAVGTRAGDLKKLFRLANDPPLPDTELETAGVCVSDTWPLAMGLPVASGAPARHADPAVWRTLQERADDMQTSLRPFLWVPEDWACSSPTLVAEEAALAQRILRVDAALRTLVAAFTRTDAAESGAATSKSLPWEDVGEAHFWGCSHDLWALCKARVLYFDHDMRSVEIDGVLMARVVSRWLDDPQHVAGVQLARTLLEERETQGKWMRSAEGRLRADQLEKEVMHLRAVFRSAIEAKKVCA